MSAVDPGPFCICVRDPSSSIQLWTVFSRNFGSLDRAQEVFDSVSKQYTDVDWCIRGSYLSEIIVEKLVSQT